MLVPKLRFKREDGADYPEWEKCCFSYLIKGKISNGLFTETSKLGRGVKLINVSDLYNEPFINYETLGLLDVDEKTLDNNRVQPNDLLFTRSSVKASGVAHCNIYIGNDFDVVFDGHIMKASIDKSKASPLFVKYLMDSPNARNKTLQKAKTGAFTTIGQEDLESVPLVMSFCLEEQQKIADFLSTVDEVIAQSEAEVQNLEQQKKAAMQKIFSQEVRFKREDGTEYPEWEEKTLQDVSQYITTTGTGIKSVYVGTENMQKGCAGVCFDCDDDIAVKGIQYVPDDILISNIRPYLKKAWKADRNGICSTDLLCIRGTSEILSDFLYTVLSSDSFFEYVMQGVKGTKMPRGDKKHIMEMPVFNPCFEEQQKIADFLSAYDEAISYAKQELDKWKELKKGLLQQMFV